MLRLYLAVQAVRAIAHSLPPLVSDSADIGTRGLEDTDSSDLWSPPLPHCASLPGLDLSRRQEELNPWGSNDLTGSIGSTSGCPQSRRTAYIGVAADCAYTASFNSTNDARQHITDVVNTASVVFENSFNVSIVVQNITLSDPECPASGPDGTGWNAACTEGDTNWRLREFSSWRNTLDDNYAYWTLFTGCASSSGEVGVSWVGALCSSSRSTEAGANVVARTQSEWQIFAHESAHTFGAAHDCTSETCGTQSSQCCPLSSNTCSADGRYIMNPISNTGMTRFSPCTIGTVCSRMGSSRVDSSCLVSRSGNRTDNGQCGNGIVETGEACDCGNGACNSRDSGCCDSLTCQWRGGSQCDSPGTRPDNNDDDRTEDTASSWVSSHLKLVIGLAAGIGGALILFVFALIVIGCRGSKKKKVQTGKIQTREPEN